MGVLELLFDGIYTLLSLLLNVLGVLTSQLDFFPSVQSQIQSFLTSSTIAATIIHDFIPITAISAILAVWIVLYPAGIGVNIFLNWLKAKF